MPISLHLQQKLQETLGTDAAGDLVSLLDGIRGDIRELRHEMQQGFARIEARFQQVDARFQQVDARFEQMEARFRQVDSRFEHNDDRLGQMEALICAKMEAVFEKGLREQTRFFFLAWSVLLAAMVGLYAR